MVIVWDVRERKKVFFVTLNRNSWDKQLHLFTWCLQYPSQYLCLLRHHLQTCAQIPVPVRCGNFRSKLVIPCSQLLLSGIVKIYFSKCPNDKSAEILAIPLHWNWRTTPKITGYEINNEARNMDDIRLN